MSAIEARARITPISSPDSGCLYPPVRGELPEVNGVPSRATSNILGHSRLLVRGRGGWNCRGYIEARDEYRGRFDGDVCRRETSEGNTGVVRTGNKKEKVGFR
jgi:hypothetical protein